MQQMQVVLVAFQAFLLHQVVIGGFNNNQVDKLIRFYKSKKCMKWCPSGRKCSLQEGKEVCVCLTKCPSRHNPVCGSDGKRYENHCELHRTACLTKTKIKIDWGNRCIADNEQGTSSLDALRVVSKGGITKDDSKQEKQSQDLNLKVFTEKPKDPMDISVHKKRTSLFFAFGNNGIHVIDPESLSLVKHIRATDMISNSQSTTCTGSPPKPCTWGGAVNAGNKKIFAADSQGQRLIVIDIQSLSVDHVVDTKPRHPLKPQYVEALDEIWVSGFPNALEFLTEDEGDNGTVHVISKATAQETPYHATQVNSNLSIYGLHVTDSCHTRDEEQFGYVTHLDEPGFHEVNLKNKEVTRFFNLSDYSCQGTYGFALSVTTSHAIAHCFTAKDGGHRGQFIVDLKTKDVVAMTTINIGIPHPSPDGRFILTLNEYTLSAVYFNHDGTIELGEPIKTNMLLSDVAFIPRDYGYDVFVTSKDSQSILVVHMNPSGMKILEVLPDAGTPNKEKDWLHTKRDIVIGCQGHARFLATPATTENAVIIIDGRQVSVSGKIENMIDVTSLVWVGEDDI